MYLHLIKVLEDNYPEMAKRLIVVNSKVTVTLINSMYYAHVYTCNAFAHMHCLLQCTCIALHTADYNKGAPNKYSLKLNEVIRDRTRGPSEGEL